MATYATWTRSTPLQEHNLHVIETMPRPSAASTRAGRPATIGRMSGASFCQNRPSPPARRRYGHHRRRRLAWEARSFRDHGYDVKERLNCWRWSRSCLTSKPRGLELPHDRNAIGIGLAELARMDNWNMPRRRQNGRILLDPSANCRRSSICRSTRPSGKDGWYVCAFSLDLEQMNCDIQSSWRRPGRSCPAGKCSGRSVIRAPS